MKSPVTFGLKVFTFSALSLLVATASTASAQNYYNGFEVDNFDWTNAVRVASNTGGVPSAEGDFHATAAPATNPFTRFGAYTTPFPTRGYDTSVDIYLDVNAGFANDVRFDWISAINNAAGTHRRDFVFNAGFYNAADVTGPGAGANRFVVSASPNSGRANSFPKNPARTPIAISSTGWYTFEHKFRKDDANVLVVQLSVYDAAGTELGTWTISDPTDVIGVTVGGNRYGWFALNEFSSSLNFDEARKTDSVISIEGELPDATPVLDGDDFDVRVGETFRAIFTGTDPDDLDLTLGSANLPPGATLTPSSGTTAGSPLVTTFEWTPETGDFGMTFSPTVSVTDEYGLQAEITFDLTVVNTDPTVGPIGVDEIELGDGQNLVSLFATVDDVDGQLLDVTWSIDGVVVPAETETNVVPGTVVEFVSDFPLGASVVTVTVTDGISAATAGTTVTVSDTIGPVVIVTPDVTVPTDPGKDFASGVVLIPPAVADNYDGDPTLTNDAPAIFPLGTTDVTWTATDSAGNETDAVQRVIVIDEEAPKIGALPAVRVAVDRGEVFATVDLNEPNSSDNVDDVVLLENDAPVRFPIGRTEVVWTATDAAGNEATKTQLVIVKNEAPVADAGSVIRVEANLKSGARVRLDGRGSSDPDGQDLAFDWSAPGIDFDDSSDVRPSAKFPVGKTVVRLVVKDEAGVRNADMVTVVVSFDQKLVADTRPFSGYVTPYVDASVSTLGAYSQQNPSSQPLAYAASFAEYAKAYDQAANNVRYRDGNLGQQTGVYLSLRNYQVYFSANAATYAYYGSGASDGYYYAATAQYYGQADLDD